MHIRDRKKLAKLNAEGPDLSSALIRLSSLVFSRPSPERIISEALRDIRKTLRARSCWMFMVEDNKIAVKGWGGKKGPKQVKSQSLLKLSPETLKHAYPIICNRIGELYKDNRVLYEFLRKRNIHKFMGVPLKKDGKLIGVLNVARDSFSQSFTGEDLKTLAKLGSVIVLAKFKQAEVEARRSYKFLETIIDNIPHPVFIKDRNHRWVVLNKSATQLIGYPKEEMLGKSDYDFFPKDQADFFWKKDEKMFRTGKIVNIPEEPITDKDGNTHYLYTKKAPLRDSAGKITHLVGIIEDITERKLAERRLKINQERYKLSTKAANIGIWDWDIKTNKFYIDPNIKEILGYRDDEIPNDIEVWSTYVHPEDREPVMAAAQACLDGKTSQYVFEHRMIHKNGSVHWMFTRGNVIRDAKGNAVRMVGTDTDITERKQAEESLWKSENKYRTLLENLPQKIFFKDNNSIYISCNKIFARDLNIRPGEIAGKTDFDFFPKNLAEKYKADDKRIMESGKIEDIEEVYIQDGQKLFVHTVKTPLKDKDGNIIGILGIFWDVTERKRADDTLIRSERIARERARLLSDLRSLDEFDDILTRVCEAVRDSGLFERAVMTLHKPAGQIFHLGQVGLPIQVIRRARQAPALDQKLKARIMSKRFRISDSFFVPDEAGIDMSKSGRYIPQKKKSPTAGDWQPGDELFVPLRDYTGKIMGYLSVDTPIHGLRPDVKTIQALEILVEAAASRIREVEAQQALKRERDFSQSILESANSMIVCLDADAKITNFNRECERVTGYGREEVLGKRWSDLFLPPDKRHHELKSFSKWVRAHPRDRYEGPIVCKNGEIRIILWSNTAVLGSKERDVIAIAIGHDITERKKAEEALRTSEKTSRALLNASHDIACLIDPDGTIVALSESTAKILRKGKDDLIGTCAFDLFPPEVSARRKAATDKVVRSGKPIRFEDERKGIWWDSSIHPVFDERGKVIRLAVFAYEITDRKRAQKALQEGEHRYRSLFEDSPISLWEEDFSKVKRYMDTLRDSGITDFRTHFESHPEEVARCAAMVKVTDVNSASLKLYKARSKEELKSGLAKIFAKESYYPFREELISIAQGKTVFQKEAVTQTLKGDKNYVTVRWTIPKGHEKKLSKVLVAITDITERKRVEEALRESERRYRTLVETAQEGIGIVDPRENFLFVNQAFADLLGYKRDELLGKNLKEISDEMQLSMFRGETRKRRKRKTSKYEITLLDKEGRPKYLYLSAAPLWNEDGSFLGTLGVVTDLTELKKIREYNILLTTSRALSKTLNFNQVLRIGTKEAAKALEADRCAVAFMDESFQSATVKHVYAEDSSSSLGALGMTLSIHQLHKAKDFLRRKGYYQIENCRTDPVARSFRGYFLQARLKSTLIIPMFTGKKKLLGLLSIGSMKRYRSFTKEEIRLAQIIANQLAVALQNCQLMEDLKIEHSRIIDQSELLKARYREQKMMFELTQVLTATRNLDQLLKSATKKAVELLKVEMSSVILNNPDGESATIRAIHTKPRRSHQDLMGHIYSYKAYSQLVKKALSLSEFFVFSDTSALPRGNPLTDFLLSQGIKSAVAVPLRCRGELLGFLTVSTLKDVHHYTPEQIKLLQAISNPIAVAIENYQLLDDLKQKYAQIEEQAATLKRQTREKDILLRVSRAISRAMTLNEISQVGSQVVGSALGAERCAVTLTAEEGEQLEIKGLFSKEGLLDLKSIGTRFSWGDIPAMSKAIKKGKPFVINNTAEIISKSKTKEYLLKEGIKSVLGAGMFFGKKLVGILSITSIKDYKTFSQEEVTLIQTMANQIAVAIENARLLEVVKKHTQDLRDLSAQLMKVQENERKRIAQELHDEVGQMLQSMKMNLDRIKRSLNSKPRRLEGIENWLLDTEELLAQTIEDIRTLTFELRPSMLDDFGLIPTLRWYVDSYSKRSNIKVSLKAKDKRYRFLPEVEVTLYRIVQEALTNVAKHAMATEAFVLVSQKNATVILSVRDNGRGFDPAKVLSAPRGIGLLNIKERVDMLGGSFEISSRTKKGTTLTINIPFSEVKYEEGQITGG